MRVSVALEKSLSRMLLRHSATLKTDASKKGVAGILYQQQNGGWKMVACCSRRLTPAETNYGMTDLEGLAVIHSLEKFRHYLLGREFEILTGYCALCKLIKTTPQSPRLKRWTFLVSEFDFHRSYTNGSLHKDVNCLSRAPLEDKDQYLEKVLAIPVPVNADDWLNLSRDAESTSQYEKAQKDDDLNWRDSIMYFKQQLYVPEAKRNEILEETNESYFWKSRSRVFR